MTLKRPVLGVMLINPGSRRDRCFDLGVLISAHGEVRKRMGTLKVTMAWGSPGRMATQATS